jgi:hypothetical protein
MPSSIFSSDDATKLRVAGGISGIVVLLGIIIALLISFEVFTRYVVERSSKVQRELDREYREAVQIRRDLRSPWKQLLVVGNSLVGQGLDFKVLQHSLSPEWQVHRYWIYNTAYEDWYFGLRRVFAEGSRPDVVAIDLAALHWYAPGIRGEYSSLYMFRAADMSEIASELELDRTRTSNLLFATYSKFYAVRSETRKVLLQALLPDLPKMYGLFKPTVSRHLSNPEVLADIEPRVMKMRKLVEANGARLVLIVPPIPRPGEEYHVELMAAARQAGVEAFIPMSCSDVPAGNFVDDMHLSPQGATLYTTKLVNMMRPALDGENTKRQMASK